MAFPKKVPSSPSLEKREERVHRDLDQDGEQGESPTHRQKVLGGKSGKGPDSKAKGKGKPFIPPKKSGVPLSPLSLPQNKKGGVCPPCKGKGMKSCSHS